MNRKDRRRLREEAVEKAAIRPTITKEAVGSELEYENAIAQSHELVPEFAQGVLGPDIEESDGFDRHDKLSK